MSKRLTMTPQDKKTRGKNEESIIPQILEVKMKPILPWFPLSPVLYTSEGVSQMLGCFLFSEIPNFLSRVHIYTHSHYCHFKYMIVLKTPFPLYLEWNWPSFSNSFVSLSLFPKIVTIIKDISLLNQIKETPIIFQSKWLQKRVDFFRSSVCSRK